MAQIVQRRSSASGEGKLFRLPRRNGGGEGSGEGGVMGVGCVSHVPGLKTMEVLPAIQEEEETLPKPAADSRRKGGTPIPAKSFAPSESFLPLSSTKPFVKQPLPLKTHLDEDASSTQSQLPAPHISCAQAPDCRAAQRMSPFLCQPVPSSSSLFCMLVKAAPPTSIC